MILSPTINTCNGKSGNDLAPDTKFKISRGFYREGISHFFGMEKDSSLSSEATGIPCAITSCRIKNDAFAKTRRIAS
jgi:hypothetical protein